MFPGAEEHYQAIGNGVSTMGPDGFQEALIRVEMIDDVSSIGVFYKMPDGTYKYRNQGLEAILDVFQTLRNAFKQLQGESWSTATFRLNAQGKMALEIGYEDVSDFGRSSERRQAWIRKYLGDNAAIDWS